MRRTPRPPNPPPADAEVFGRLKFKRWNGDRVQPTGTVLVRAWRGTESRPFAFYLFKSASEAERWVQETIEQDERAVRGAAERKAKQVADLENIRASLVVGSILHYAWGYEQTQCEFFQVTRRTASTAWIREITAETVPGSDNGGMCDLRRPVPDAFEGPELRKRINSVGVTMEHGRAMPCDRKAEKRCSWYG